MIVLLVRCARHGRNCPRKPEPAGVNALLTVILTMLVAGSACTDFSAYGNMQMAAGPTMLFLLILLRMVAEWQPMVFIHENVVHFPMVLLKDTLDELYDFEEHILQPQLAGYPIERRRKYCIGRLRLKLKLLGDMNYLD